MERFENLTEMHRSAWNLLLQATQNRKEAFRTPAIATVNAKNEPSVRTVVLRETIVEEKVLCFFTDNRSAKVRDLQQNAMLSCLFWDAERQLQLRIKSQVVLHHQDELCQRYWSSLSLHARKSYAAIVSPGQVLAEKGDGLEDSWQKAEMDVSASEQYFTNFLVIKAIAQSLDILHLHPQGHQRAHFDYQKSAEGGEWLVP